MFGDTPLIMVETPEALDKMVEAFSNAPVIGVDTESDSFYSYQEKVCLIQFSDNENDYIVDPLAVPDLSALAPIMARRDIIKIFHGADYDVVCMKRDFDFEIHGLFDTMIAAQMLALPKLGLADLIGHWFGWEIDKKYQRHDWGKRPLLDDHLAYARGDTHWLLSLRELLIRRLKRAGRLSHLREECRILESREWPTKAFDEDGYLRIKKSGTLDDKGKRILKYLYLHRDEVARKLDRPTFKVLSDHLLIDVAKRRPSSKSELDKLFPKKDSMKRRHGAAMLDAVERGLSEDWSIPKPKRPKRTGPKPRLTGRQAEKAFNELKDWRNNLCKKNDKLTPIGVASNGTLKAIAAARPLDLEEFAAVEDVRKWQVEWFGEDMLKVLDKAVPADKIGQDDDDDDGDKPKRRRRRKKSS